ncbi:helix-turn-helix transcriptional regulator [Derxia gummosa]|uniref:Helix-turn-helix transcriptional regulator n=1 Tax=Derxia gummosa DSM 723 TaxID=1121388 RepID=A0A8B6X885_9BURK|nr:LuxR C-terminal-related transcriptional regulator [Derxia gummosa]
MTIPPRTAPRLDLIDREPLFGLGLDHALESRGVALRPRMYGDVMEWMRDAQALAPPARIVVVDVAALGPDARTALAMISHRARESARMLVVRDRGAMPSLHADWGAWEVVARRLPAQAFVERLIRLADARAPTPHATAAITPRQQEVLTWIARGEPNKRIAARLDIAERTVKLHVTALLGSLGARNRTQAVIRAFQLGLLGPGADGDEGRRRMSPASR